MHGGLLQLGEVNCIEPRRWVKNLHRNLPNAPPQTHLGLFGYGDDGVKCERLRSTTRLKMWKLTPGVASWYWTRGGRLCSSLRLPNPVMTSCSNESGGWRKTRLSASEMGKSRPNAERAGSDCDW